LVSPTLIFALLISGFCLAQEPATQPFGEQPPDITQLRRLIQAQRRQQAQDRTTQTATEEGGEPMVEIPVTQPVTGPVELGPGITEDTTQPIDVETLPGARGDGLIYFSFQNAPYSALLDLLERQTGLPIIGDRDIQGETTYVSTKGMTVEEAISEVNLLLPEPSVVVRQDGYLRISKFPDVLREVGRYFIGAEEFLESDVSPSVVVRVLFRVENLPANELVNLVAQALPVGRVTLAAWKTSNFIQAVGLASEVRDVVVLALELDQRIDVTDPGLTVRVFQPKYITATGLATALEKVLPQAVVGPGDVPLDDTPSPAPRGRAPAAAAMGDAVSIAADEKAGIVVVKAPASMMDYVSQLVEMIDVPGEAGEDVEIVALRNAKAEDIYNRVLQPYYREMKRPLPAAADKVSNSIAIWATGKEKEELTALIQELDETAIGGRPVPVVRTYRLEEVDLAALVKTLQDIFGETASVTFAMDRVANLLIVAAPDEQHGRIEPVIEELRSKLGQLDETRLVKLQYADATDVSRTLKQVQSGVKRPANRSPVSVSEHPQSNAIVVSGPREDVQATVELIERLDEEVRQTDEIKTYTLQHASVDEVVKTINNLYGGKSSRLKIVADAWTNTLFVSGAGAMRAEIEELLARMDQPVEATEAEAETPMGNIDFIHLRYASAEEAADQIEEMLYPTAGTPAGTKPAQTADIDASKSGNYLVVTGPEKQVERVRQLAKQIDEVASKIPDALTVKAIQKISAARLAQMLEVVIPELLGANVQIVEIDVGGEESDLKKLMDVPSTQPDDERTRIVIGVDRKNNNLLIRSRPWEVEQISSVITTLTTDVEDDVEFEIYALQYANPSEVAQNLEAVFNDVTVGPVPPPQPQPQANQPPQPPAPPGQPQPPQARQARTPRQAVARTTVNRRIRAIPLDTMSAVIIRAEPRDFEPVKKLIEQLDQPQSADIRIFHLRYARAEAVVKNISEVLGTRRAGRVARSGMGFDTSFSISADPASNAVIVSADKAETEQIEAIIAALDHPTDTEVAMQVLPLKRGRADELARMIQTLLNQAEQIRAGGLGLRPQPIALSADAMTNSLVFVGPARVFEEVKRLVNELDGVRAGGNGRPWIIPVRRIPPERAKQLLEELLPDKTRGDASEGGLYRSMAQVPFDAPGVSPLIVGAVAAVATGAVQLPIERPEVLSQQFEAPAVPASPTTRPVLSGKELEEVIREIVARHQTSTQPAAGPAVTTQPRVPSISPEAAADLHGLIQGVSPDVEITALPEQGALLVYGSEEDYQAIQRILEFLDRSQSRPEVKVIKLQSARAADLAPVLSSIYGRRPQPPGLPPITFTADKTSNSIIVSASSEDIDEIAAMIQSLDSQEQPLEIEFRTYMLRNARASEVAGRLQEMVQQIMTARGVTAPPLTITADDRTNTILVSAPANYFDHIERIIEMLDSVPSFATATMEIIRLKQTDARSLAATLMELLTPASGQGQPKSGQFEIFRRLEMAAEREGGKFTLDLEKPIMILPDQPTQTLAILSTPENLVGIKALVSLYDRVPLFEELRVRAFPLKNADAQELVGVLENLFNKGGTLTDVPGTGRQAGVPENPTGAAVVYSTAFAADPRTNTVIVSGHEVSIALAEVLIMKLDEDRPADIYPIEMIPLEHADASGVANVIQEIMDRRVERAAQLGTGRAAERMRVIIKADPRTNNLLVSAAPETVETIKDLVQRLDQAPTAGFAPTVMNLQNLDAIEVAELINDVFEAQARVRREAVREGEVEPAPVIIPDPASNSLIVVATRQGLEETKRLIDEIDRLPAEPGVTVRVYPLETASAAALQPMIETLLEEQKRTAKAPSPTVLADQRTNSLIVYGSKSDQALMAGIVKQLDQPGSADQRVRVFPLEKADAEAIKEIIDEIYTERAAAGAEAEAVTVVVDERTNSLIVYAAPDDMQTIGNLVQRLDTIEITKRLQIAVIPVISADAGQLAEALRDMLSPQEGGQGLRQSVILEFMRQTPEGERLVQQAVKDQVFIYGDEENNFIIVIAAEETVGLVQALVKHIDEVAPTIEMRIFPLENADAGQMEEMLSELFGEERGGRGEGAAPAITAEGVTAAGRIVQETFSVTADTRTNSVIVTGTPEYLKLVERIVKHLDEQEAKEQITEVISLRNAKAPDIQQAVSTFVENQLNMLREVYGAEGMAPERLLEQQVNVVAYEDTQKIILQASPKYFKTVREIISELDEMPLQVMIDAVLVEVTLNDRLEYGFEAVGQDLAFTKASNAQGTPGIGPGHDVVVGTDVGAAGTGVAGFTFALNSEDLNLLFRALSSDGRLSVLSRPHISARDNAAGLITSGSRVPFPTASVTSGDTGVITTQIQYEDVALSLEVTPHVNPYGFVNMEVATEISDLSGSTVQISEGFNAPIYNQRKLTTEITVHDGETVVIGGLLRSRKEQRETKVPFLGDVPLLGLFFKSATATDEQSELLIVMTPRVIGTPVEEGHLTPAELDMIREHREYSVQERDLLHLLPGDILTSELMQGLQVTPEELATRPAPLKPDAKKLDPLYRLFNPPPAPPEPELEVPEE